MSGQVNWAKEIAVIKIGGSVLTDIKAYRRCAELIRRRLDRRPRERLVVVVSAQNGITDALLRLARGIVPKPDAAALDLLWSTGELRSVAILTLQLQSVGVPASGLNVHETGLVSPDGKRDVGSLELNSLRLRFALAHGRVVIVPGFLARGPFNTIVSLGRGGSDLTAVLLAQGLGALRCELVKDVPGYFDKDPNRFADAKFVPSLSYDEALRLADAGCDLVQRQAIEAAERHNVPLVIRDLVNEDHCSVVSNGNGILSGDDHAICHENDSRRAAVGA